MTLIRTLVLFSALVLAPIADAAISLRPLVPNYDLTISTEFPEGDKPVAGCTPPTGYTEAEVGNGGGEICEQSATEFDFSVLGTRITDNAHLAYKDAGAGDVQIEARITDSFAGVTEPFSGVGVGIRETAAAGSWLFQCFAFQTGATAIQVQYGTSGAYTTVNGLAGVNRPVYCAATYDVSSGDIKAFGSEDGSSWTEIASTNRAMSDVLGYMVGASKSASLSLQVTLDNFALGSTIDVYTPTDPDPGSPPELVSAIPNQTGTQGTAFSLTFSSYFTGATSYSVTGLPGAGGLSESSDGVISGTPDADDASFTASLCAANADGETCDSVLFTFAPAAGSGSLFVAPDVNDVKSVFNCGVTTGANGSNWSAIRTSGSNTRPMPGDVIEITSGSRGATEFANCHGDESNYITIKKTASATRLTITGTGDANDAFLLRDSTYVHVNGLLNWTGHTTGCGADSTLSETPLTDCGILVDGTAQFLFKYRGQAFNIIVEGVELDGNWPGTAVETGADVAISPNDQQYCVSTAPTLLNREFRSDLIVRHNYMHHVAHELMYFGPNVDYGTCAANTETPRLKDIYHGYNYLAFAGWDGHNLKSAFTGTNIVEYNVITDIGGGTTASGANSVGISLFESEGIVRYNKVRRTTDPPGGARGINCSANKAPANWGTLDCQVYGNDVSDTDGPGIALSKGAQAAADRSGAIYNNTVTDTGGQCILVANTADGGGTVQNNIAVSCGAQAVSVQGAGWTADSNQTTCTEAATCGFVNPGANNYQITAGSLPHNAGVLAVCPELDILGVTRPQGGGCDMGAYEVDD